MSGDYSRIRFDPRKDIASVWMQQGRVQLDSDWNEGMAALDRRLRAESVDTFGVHPVPGRTGVAVVSPQTPDAFKIEISEDGPLAITIGRGRMYVDGLLVENHGGGEEVFDPVLAELRGQSSLDYYQQPYFLEPSPPPEGPYLAYLEVWQRELTHLQYPEMVENAVGVDTTTRWQIVWQVRFLALGGESEEESEGTHVNCSTPDDRLPGWQTLTRPSAGRMSIKAEVAPPDTGPCELPPSGGYRGLENQLYRIEIHNGGAVGAATFKWSRDNASVASSVVEILEDGKKLRLASLGRDTVLRFNAGDWVEILDDWRELDGAEDGDPALRRREMRHGEMRRITVVSDDMQTIEFSPALPADLIPAGGDDTLAARHTRVRRWDQKGTVRDTNGNLLANLDDPNSSGLIPISALGVWVELEKGIQVRFSLDPAGGEFRSGDYWVSAARTADTSIETFTDAPPRGIHRHYARLAIVDLRDNERVISDCRIHWPPACGGCCTITVAPGESIQAALDALPDEGGCVCLKTGVHIINEPIRINRSNVILQGESPGVTVHLEYSEYAFFVLGIGIDTEVSNVVVHRIRFEAAQMQVLWKVLLVAYRCVQLQVTYCEFVVTATTSNHTGLWCIEVSNPTIANNRIQNVLAGIWLNNNKDGGYIDIHDNFIEGAFENNEEVGFISRGYGGITLIELINGQIAEQVICHIENNVIRHFQVGISLNHYAAGSVVIGNHIYYGASSSEQEHFDVGRLFDEGIEKLTDELDKLSYVIDIAAADCKVRHNVIDLGGKGTEGGDASANGSGGIRIRAPGVAVAANRLRNQHPQLPSPIGIYCRIDEEGHAADQVTISDNHLLEFQIGIMVSDVDNATINGNFIRGGWLRYFGVMLYDCNHSYVRDNILQDLHYYALLSHSGRHNHIRGNRINEAIFVGIALVAESDPEISGNYLYSCGIGSMLTGLIGVVTLSNNRFMNCGYGVDGGEISIAVFSVSAAIRIDGCEIIDTGVTANGVFQATHAGGIVVAGSLTALRVTNNRVDYINPAVRNGEHCAFLFHGMLSPLLMGSTLITGNHFRGPGQSALVEFQSTGPLGMVFSNNICDHFDLKKDNNTATVILSGSNNNNFTVMGNQIVSVNPGPSLSLRGNGSAIFMGNTMTGGFYSDIDTIPSPSKSFNIYKE